MKDLKKKLTAAGAMLVVSAVMLSGVSYAWYTLSTNPEVKGINANIAANENLEIALDDGYATGEKPATGNDNSVDKASEYATGVQGSKSGNPYTWGNLVDLSKAMGTLTGNSATTKLVLAPVKYTGTEEAVFNYPQYGLDGRVSALGNIKNGSVISDYDGAGTKGGVQGWKQSDSSTTYDALSVTYWLRSNENCTVDLSAEGTKRASSDNDTAKGENDVNTVKGSGSYIEIPVSGENTKTRVEKYAENLVVQLNVDSDNPIYARLTSPTDVQATANEPAKVKFTLALNTKKTGVTDGTATSISLTANTAKKVTMYVYIDGETITNADALLDDISGMTMNVQFKSTPANGGNSTPGAMNGTTATTN